MSIVIRLLTLRHGDALWPEAARNGWRHRSLKRYISNVYHYKTGA